MQTDKKLELIYEEMEKTPRDDFDGAVERCVQMVKNGSNWGGAMALAHIYRPVLLRNREKATQEFVKKGLNQRQIAYLFGYS